MLSPIALATLAAATLGVAAPTSMSHNSGNTTLIEVFERATPAPVSCGRMFIDGAAPLLRSQLTMFPSGRRPTRLDTTGCAGRF
jgi:hypothetical protein